MGLRPIISDPTGTRYGFPTYRWGDAPRHLMTIRQLAAAGLRPGGQDPVAEMRRYERGPLVAYLYDSRTAAKKRTTTPAMLAAVAKATAARLSCPLCRRDPVVPQLGVCDACNARPDLESAA